MAAGCVQEALLDMNANAKKYGKLALYCVVVLVLTHLILVVGCGKNPLGPAGPLSVGIGRM
jgi:hypothetical protein